MDLDKLRGFYNTAKLGNITKATTAIHLTQSAISRQIAGLEEDLGVKLFTRTHRQMKLTDSGRILYDFVGRIFDEFSQIEANIKGDVDSISGQLKIAATVGYAETYLPDVLKGFLRKYPNLNVSLLSMDQEVEILLKMADVAIRPKLPETTGIVQDLLMSNRMRLYASQDYLDQYGVPQQIEDLDKHKLIAFGDHTSHPFHAINYHLTLGKKAGEVRVPYLQMNSPQTRCNMAQSGFGITPLSEYHYKIQGEGLVEVLGNLDHPVVDIYFIYPEHMRNYQRIILLRDFLKKQLSN